MRKTTQQQRHNTKHLKKHEYTCTYNVLIYLTSKMYPKENKIKVKKENNENPNNIFKTLTEHKKAQ